MSILVLVTLALAAGFAWLLMHEERPILFPPPPTPTFAEAMAMFTIRLKELQVAFGTAFLPVVKNVAEAMTTFVDKVKESNIALATRGFCPVCGNVIYDGTCIVKGHP